MKWPWLIAILVLIICTIPLGVTGDNGQSWDTYQTTWTQINYANATFIEINHPVNGSLVSDNQKLNFIVVPFDADQLTYTIDVYKNDILMYTCNQEKVYDLNIYTNNPINQIITVIFKLNNQEVLRLEYIAILTGPSLDQDFTDQWLQYQAQKENESLSGRGVVNIRDEKLNDINLVAMTGIICIAFTTIAGIIVIVFKLLSMMNFFTGFLMFLSGLFWLNGIRGIDATMRDIPTVTATDVSIYYSNIVILTMIFCFSLIAYVIGYKIGKSRLTPWKFWGNDIKKRTVIQYETVIHKHKGKYYWWIQNSWDAFKQAILKRLHPLVFEHGDLTDTFRLVQAKNIPENNDSKKEFRAMNKLLHGIHSKMAFYTKPVNETDDSDDITPKEKDKDDLDLDDKYNFEAWKYQEDGGILRGDIPIIWIDGPPQAIDGYTEDEYKSMDEQLSEIKEKVEKGVLENKIKDVEKAKKRFKLFQKNKPKPTIQAMKIKLSNANNYSMLHFLDDANYVEKLSQEYTKKDKQLHQANVKMEVDTTKKAQWKYEERDRQILDAQERKNKEGSK